VRVTTLERALVDTVDAPDKGGGWEEMWRSLESVEFFDLDAVIDYARKLGSAIAAARVGFFLDQHREPLMVEAAHLDRLKELGPKEPRYFDPKRQPGKLVSTWRGDAKRGYRWSRTLSFWATPRPMRSVSSRVFERIYIPAEFRARLSISPQT
jgi:hypothetical protein